MRSIRGADGLRALACLMVVFHHLFQRLDLGSLGPEVQWVAGFALTGFSGVTIFFVLSGFLLSHPFWSAYAEGAPRPGLGVYALRRAARIMPGFYANLFFCFFLSLALVPEAPQLFVRYLAGLTFTSGAHWLSLFPTELNGPLWSIGFEVFSYVLMPLGMVGLFWVFGKNRSMAKALGWWVFLFAVVLGLNQLIQTFCQPDSLGRGWEYGLVGGAKEWTPNYNLLGFFGHFSVGILSAGLSVLWSRSPRVAAWAQKGWFDALAALLVAAWLVVIWFARGQGEYFLSIQNQPDFFPLFPAINGLLLACLCQSRFLGKAFDNPFCAYTARVSFGLYLWHMVIMEIVRVLWIPPFANDQMTDLGTWALGSLAVLGGAYLVASLSWFFFEKPLLDRAHRWKPGTGRVFGPRGRRALLVAAAVLVLVPAGAALAFPGARNSAQAYFPQATVADAPVPEGKGTLTVRISRARNDHGNLILSLYSPGDFEESTVVRRAVVDPKPGETQTVVFEGLPFGVYAVSGIHDEDGDGELAMGASGRPTEGYISATGLAPTGPPVFDKAKFTFRADQTLERPVFYF